jgi:putative exporter of polyketide antibiotics
LKSQVSSILAIIPHLATKADIARVEVSVARVEAKLAGVETAIIKWIIATALTAAALAFAIAKFVH